MNRKGNEEESVDYYLQNFPVPVLPDRGYLPGHET